MPVHGFDITNRKTIVELPMLAQVAFAAHCASQASQLWEQWVKQQDPSLSGPKSFDRLVKYLADFTQRVPSSNEASRIAFFDGAPLHATDVAERAAANARDSGDNGALAAATKATQAAKAALKGLEAASSAADFAGSAHQTDFQRVGDATHQAVLHILQAVDPIERPAIEEALESAYYRLIKGVSMYFWNHFSPIPTPYLPKTVGEQKAPDITFPPVEPTWVFDRDCVLFLALRNGQTVRCLVTLEALIWWFQSGSTPEEALETFSANKQQIHDLALKKLAAPTLNARGEVVLVSDDRVSPHKDYVGVTIQPEIKKESNLHELITKASRIILKVTSRASHKVVAKWGLVHGTTPPVVQLSLTDQTNDVTVNDWLTEPNLIDTEFLTRRVENLWGDLLQAVAHKQVDAISRKES